MKSSNTQTDEEFIYCDNRKCDHKDCIRRISNAPWNVYIRVDKYQQEKDGNCKYEVKEQWK